MPKQLPVATSAYLCPGCAGELDLTSVRGERKYGCPNCGGCVIMVAALRQLAPAAAVQIWTEDPATGPAPAALRCTFCGNEMRQQAVPCGCCAVCRPCEAVWLDRQASEAIRVELPLAQPGPTLSSVPMRCPQCGAPVTNNWDEECRYCGSALHTDVQPAGLPN